MAKKKKGWMKRERNRAEAAAKVVPKSKPKIKVPNGRNIITEFCPGCDKPKDKRCAVLGEYANPARCSKKDCPLKDPFEPKDAEGKMKFNINGRVRYAPSGPFSIGAGGIKSHRRKVGLKKKADAWLEKQKAKKKT